MIDSHQSGGELTLTLNRPDRANALGSAMVEALLAQVGRAVADDSVQRLVLRAAGPHFCTGLDLSDLDACSDGDLLHRLVRIETLLSLLWHAPMQTVAVAQGRTWGAGADLFAACEVRVATSGSSYRFPGAQFGIVLGTRRLAEHVGAECARRLVTDGVQLDAAQALATGLATHDVLPDWAPPVVNALTASAVRRATRADQRDSDLAALVRSAAEPGLKQRIVDYTARLRAQHKRPPG